MNEIGGIRTAPQALVVDEISLQVLDAALIEEQWFTSFELPPEAPGVRRVQIGNVVYIISRLREISRLLVIDVSSSGVFRHGDNKRLIFERILRVAMRNFDRSVSIPSAWQVYHDGSRLSVYAGNQFRSTLKRIYFEQSPAGHDNIYAFAQTEKRQLYT